jgi:hypothetical protein
MIPSVSNKPMAGIALLALSAIFAVGCRTEPYRALRQEDGLRLSFRAQHITQKMPKGTDTWMLDKEDGFHLYLDGRDGKPVEIPLKRDTVLEGNIETRDFGPLHQARDEPRLFLATESQIAKLRSFQAGQH